jgi:hypothetical protein
MLLASVRAIAPSAMTIVLFFTVILQTWLKGSLPKGEYVGNPF